MKAKEYINNHRDYSIFFYGAGVGFARVYKILEDKFRIQGVIDMQEGKWGRVFGNGIVCKSPEVLKGVHNPLVIVTVDKKDMYDEIVLSMNRMGIKAVIHVGDIIKEIRNAEMRMVEISVPIVTEQDLFVVDAREEIDKKEITFVVTGKMIYDSGIPSDRSIQSIRKFFPESKIILSTWNGENIEPVKEYCDEIIFTDEPMAEFNIFLNGHTPQKVNNINKQQLVVNKGMKQVQTRYAVRFRTDFELRDDRFVEFYSKWNAVYDKRDRKYCVFSDRILAVNTFMHNPDVFDNAYSYMLSDCFLFGKTEDLLELWDGYQAPSEIMNYFESNPTEQLENPAEFNHRYNAEQIFLLHILEKCTIPTKRPSYYGDSSDKEIVKDYEKIIASNIIIGTNKDLGLYSRFEYLFDYIFYTHQNDVYFYLKYIDADNSVCNDFIRNT